MAVDIQVPELGESISEVQIAEWLVSPGETVRRDQDLVRVDSEKATVDIPAPADGTLSEILVQAGTDANVGDVIGRIEPAGEKPGAGKKQPKKASQPEPKAEPGTGPEKPAEQGDGKRDRAKPTAQAAKTEPDTQADTRVMPAARRLLEEHGLTAGDVTATGPGGRLLKEDVVAHLEAPPARETGASGDPRAASGTSQAGEEPEDEVKPMTPLRRTVAKRLVEAQQTMAILTTFNEVDMSAVIALRKQYQEAFQAKYEVKLGFMSFFVKAVIEALKEVPQLNAEIRGHDIVYHRRFDIGVAIGAGKGLVVPPLRQAERLSFAETEQAIADLAARARVNKLKPEELEGGTFTISNGGVYGSMLSTPIINPPQSGILGLHAIQERPVAQDGQVVIRPMMFVALSYDHRLVDGREAVTFLRRVKEIIEDPARLMLEV
jgi:2-oxoglutarate dehydrogenase E2 component (dihydrolipoamide succinyltransferase)